MRVERNIQEKLNRPTPIQLNQNNGKMRAYEQRIYHQRNKKKSTSRENRENYATKIWRTLLPTNNSHHKSGLEIEEHTTFQMLPRTNYDRTHLGNRMKPRTVQQFS